MPRKGDAQREQRLAEKLRENLKRRKSQARSRASGADDSTAPGDGPAEDSVEVKPGQEDR